MFSTGLTAPCLPVTISFSASEISFQMMLSAALPPAIQSQNTVGGRRPCSLSASSTFEGANPARPIAFATSP